MTNYIWNIFKKNLIIIYFKCISFRWWYNILFKIKMDLFIHSWNLCRSKLNSIYINLFAIAYNFRRIIYKMWVNFSRTYQKFYLLFNDSLFFYINFKSLFPFIYSFDIRRVLFTRVFIICGTFLFLCCWNKIRFEIRFIVINPFQSITK